MMKRNSRYIYCSTKTQIILGHPENFTVVAIDTSQFGDVKVIIGDRSPLLVSAHCGALPCNAIHPFEIWELNAYGSHAYFWQGLFTIVPAAPLQTLEEAKACLARWAENFTAK